MTVVLLVAMLLGVVCYKAGHFAVCARSDSHWRLRAK